MKRLSSPRRLAVVTAVVLIALIVAALPHRTSAHPLGNFTVNQYSRIEATTGGLKLTYVLDMAEIPTFQERQSIDTDGDSQISDAERDAYLSTKIPTIAADLHLSVEGVEQTLSAVQSELSFPDGQAGLKIERLRIVFALASSPFAATGTRRISYQNDFEPDRIGWKEIVVTHGEGVVLDAPGLSGTDTSNELRSYPADLLKSPLDQHSASFVLAFQPGAPAAEEFARSPSSDAQASAVSSTSSRPNGGSTGAKFASLLDGDKLSTTGILLALLLAMVWGAMHALSPGHGKTVVGAYLVGSRGTPRHAVFLGATVTITHTAGVIALGLVTLFASRYIVPEQLYPWMSIISGSLVVAMGMITLRQRLRGGGAVSRQPSATTEPLAVSR